MRMTLGLRFKREFHIMPRLSHYPNHNSRYTVKALPPLKDLPNINSMVSVHRIRSLSHTYAHSTSTHTNEYKVPALHIFLIPIVLFSCIFHAPCSVFSRARLLMLLEHNWFSTQNFHWFLTSARGRLFQ